MTSSTATLRRRGLAERALAPLIALFAGTIVFSLAGSLLVRFVPSVVPFFAGIGIPYEALVKGPTWLYMGLMPVIAFLMYVPSLGARRVVLFALWGSAVGAASELAGTTTGLPFGEYVYTTWLGPKIAGHVPYFIPPSWFAMSIVSLDLAYRVTKSRFGRVLVGALFMVLWDVSLDPAMNRAFPFWTYPGGGFFYGMPLSNWVGWLVVSLVIAAGYEYLLGGLKGGSPWAFSFYALNAIFPFFLSLIYGLPGAFAAGLGALALIAGWLAWRNGPEALRLRPSPS